MSDEFNEPERLETLTVVADRYPPPDDEDMPSAPPPPPPTEPLSGQTLHVGLADYTYLAACSEPDFCRVGNSVVGFDSTATLDNPVRYSPNVVAAGRELYRVGDLFQGVQGDAGQHVVSGTSQGSGHVLITGGQDNVKANGLPIARHDSPCQINCNASGVGGAAGYLTTVQKTVESTPEPASGEGPDYSPGEEGGRVLRDKWEGAKAAAKTAWESLPFTRDEATTDAARGRVVQGTKDTYEGLSTLAGPSLMDIADSAVGWATGDAERAGRLGEELQRTGDAWGGIWDAGVEAWQEAEERNGAYGAMEMSAAVIGFELLGGKGTGAAKTAGELGGVARRTPETPPRTPDGEGTHISRRSPEPQRVQLNSRDEFRAASRNPQPNTIYEFDGFTYTTDEFGRGISSSGNLRLRAGGNRFHDDRLIGHQGVEGDIGFHGGADQFGFQGGPLNVSPGNRSLNSREYYAFERDLKDHLEAGSTVEADFRRVFYPGNTSIRPDEYVVDYRIGDGRWARETFINQPGG
ncbi:MAG: DNA/RNA non-specific endonuclease [Halomonas sp.]|uniref:DNA/RNA non-specific endonuclease n=1 Tax=Halomonas sp. TaxID=1486246 RepID=UPI003F8E3E5D